MFRFGGSRQKLTLTCALVALMLGGGVAAAQAEQCTRDGVRTGSCSGAVQSAVNAGGVDLGAGGTTPGGGGSRGNASGGGASPDDSTGGGFAPRPVTPWCTPKFCRDGYTVTSALDGHGPVTWADLASFRPVAGAVRMEPDGWSVVGLETNLVADTVAHEVAGELVGHPAVVRFTPVGYRWEYGDGSSASTRQGGTSWAVLGESEFSPTSTSHVFERAGTFGIRSTVEYRADYRFGADAWVPVAGTLAVPLADRTVVVGRAATVLVGRDCQRNEAGPGC